MSTLSRYIAVRLGTHFLYALAILLAIFSVVNLMRELGDVGTGDYRFADALWFLLLTLVPLAAVSLISYHSAYRDLQAEDESSLVGVAQIV